MRLADRFGRKINYLRLSVTDRCNMRCVYCMPATGVEKLAHADVLSYEQFLLLARAAVSIGIEKIRVTGGEPLVRRGIIPFLEQLGQIPGLKQLVLTTNGVLLPSMAQQLKNAGIKRLNISLDSLDPVKFQQLTRTNLLSEVLAGIDAVQQAGLNYKINTVVMRGRNDDEILNFAEFAEQRGCAVRFIEYMPTLNEPGWERFLVPRREILQLLQNHYSLERVNHSDLAGPAEEFGIIGGCGRLGVVAPLSEHFCASCNRIRITAGGKVRTCLFSDTEDDLRPLLNVGNLELLAARLRTLVDSKPAGHRIAGTGSGCEAFAMAGIGG